MSYIFKKKNNNKFKLEKKEKSSDDKAVEAMEAMKKDMCK